MLSTNLLIIIILAAAVAATILLRKLTVAGALTGGILAWLLYKGTGVTGLCMMAAFFIAGTTATATGRHKKEKLGIAGSRRTAGQVLANGGVAGIAGLLAWCFPDTLWQLVAAAALSSACADTLSSELGSVYGSRFYNILTLKKDTRGLDGVISIEGTAWGLAGSLLIAVVYSIGYEYTGHALYIIIAGTTGNLADSVLGAAWERKGILTNDLVNGLNTFIAAITIALLTLL